MGLDKLPAGFDQIAQQRETALSNFRCLVLEY